MKKPTPEQLLADTTSNLTWSEIALKWGYSDARFLRKLSVRYGLPARRQTLRPDKATLENLIFAQGMNIYQVAEYLGYGNGGWSNVYAYCREYGVKFDFTANADLRATEFSPRQLSFIYGTLLGDGTLRRSGQNYCLVVRHTVKQAEYVEWKLQIMRNFVVSDSYFIRAFKSAFSEDAKAATFSTIVHPELTALRSFCYPSGAKTVSNEWLGKLDALSLAVWYMDDGSRNKSYGTLTLCTNSFTLVEHAIIQDWFREQWGIDVKIEPRRNGQFSIRVNASEAPKLLDIVRPHIPPCMAYKLGE